MAYKNPLDLAEAIQKGEQKWAPKKFESLAAFNDALPSPWYKFEDGDYSGTAKIYDTPSEYGINEGRVSKFQLNHKGKPILNYDRGWDTPDGKFKIDPQHQEFYDKILSFLDSYGLG